MTTLTEIANHIGMNMDEMRLNDYNGGNMMLGLSLLLCRRLDTVGHPISLDELDDMMTEALALSIDL